MTKHELLDFIDESDSITLKDIIKTFNVTCQCASQTINRLRSAGHINQIYIIKNGKRGRPIKVFSLTKTGMNKLTYFNEYKCSNDDCLCRKSRQGD